MHCVRPNPRMAAGQWRDAGSGDAEKEARGDVGAEVSDGVVDPKVGGGVVEAVEEEVGPDGQGAEGLPEGGLGEEPVGHMMTLTENDTRKNNKRQTRRLLK